MLDKGKAERDREIAKNMIADNKPLEKIVRYTGLSDEEVENLR